MKNEHHIYDFESKYNLEIDCRQKNFIKFSFFESQDHEVICSPHGPLKFLYSIYLNSI